MDKEKYDLVVQEIQRRYESFYRLAYTYVREREAALDIVQNAVCKALEHYENLHEAGAVKSWLYQIVIHESLIYIRKNKHEVLLEEDETVEIPYYETSYEPEDEVHEKISCLPEKMRTVIMLRFYEDLSLQEIAQATNANLSTVKSRLYQGLSRLKEEYEVEP